MKYRTERNRILKVCRLLLAKEYFMGTWGNVSIRIGDHIILTPSKVDYALMSPRDMVVIDITGNRVEGERTPTSEKEVHRQIYGKRPDIGAVIHAHTKYAMAMAALEQEEVPCINEEMSQLLGGAIPVTSEYIPAEQHYLLGEAAAARIGKRNGLLLRNHGPVACGRNIDEALLAIQVVEKACEIFSATSLSDKVATIPGQAIESEHYRYFYKYGKENT